MVDINKLLPLVRTAVFGAVSLFALVVFATSVHLISVTNAYRQGAYYDFAALGLATALLSLLSLPAMFVISLKRRGAVSSYIAAEVGWLWFLWIMWISTAGSTASVYWVNLCSSNLCSEAQAIEAFSFLNWIILLAYTTTLLVVAIMAHTRGHTRVWTSEVRHFDWSAPAALKGGVVGAEQEKQYTGTSATVTLETSQVTDGSAPPQQYPPQSAPGASAGHMSYAPQV